MSNMVCASLNDKQYYTLCRVADALGIRSVQESLAKNHNGYASNANVIWAAIEWLDTLLELENGGCKLYARHAEAKKEKEFRIHDSIRFL